MKICDIDHFKRINDKYGHQCGDHVLHEFAGIIRSSIRDGVDTLVRYGGEEFLLLLPETDISGAFCIAERLRLCIAKTAITWKNTTIRLTASFGLAEYDYRGSNEKTGSDDLIMVADKNLYQAKANGRNVVFGAAK
ncbi:MAG: GGDEF domain-containing protein [Desulfobacterales bacterium]